MTLIICIILDSVKISTSLILLFLGVTTDRATEVIKIWFDLFKLRKLEDIKLMYLTSIKSINPQYASLDCNGFWWWCQHLTDESVIIDHKGENN